MQLPPAWMEQGVVSQLMPVLAACAILRLLQWIAADDTLNVPRSPASSRDGPTIFIMNGQAIIVSQGDSTLVAVRPFKLRIVHTVLFVLISYMVSLSP